VSDESLTTVLKKHFNKLRPGAKIEDVLRDDGSRGIIDLLLAREIPHGDGIKEFLVVELKRPNQPINLEVKNQLESDGLAVAGDERFDPMRPRWTFIAISNEITDDARRTVQQTSLPRGFFHAETNVRMGLAQWSEIIHSCHTRLKLFRESLGSAATAGSGVELLRAKYAEYLPNALKAEPDATSSI
jgi:hypothetical protein